MDKERTATRSCVSTWRFTPFFVSVPLTVVASLMTYSSVVGTEGDAAVSLHHDCVRACYGQRGCARPLDAECPWPACPSATDARRMAVGCFVAANVAFGVGICILGCFATSTAADDGQAPAEPARWGDIGCVVAVSVVSAALWVGVAGALLKVWFGTHCGRSHAAAPGAATGHAPFFAVAAAALWFPAVPCLVLLTGRCAPWNVCCCWQECCSGREAT